MNSSSRQARPIQCPCCNQEVAAPTLELIIDHYKLTPKQSAILRAVWRGRGFPVTTDRIFDIMYEDDPDGGPGTQRMYSAFKTALSRLRDRLEGSGVNIETVGYRQGYRLKLGDK